MKICYAEDIWNRLQGKNKLSSINLAISKTLSLLSKSMNTSGNDQICKKICHYRRKKTKNGENSSRMR
jgi:hypothetical protein